MNNNVHIINYYTLHRGEIIDFIAVRISDADEAQDMVQDIFLRLLRGHRLITPQTLPCLIYTMARHAVVDYHRRRHAYEAYEHSIKRMDSTQEIESVISAQQLMERLERSLARLPEACAKIYRLHIYDGLKVSDIAKELSLPYKQVENRLGQARKYVRQRLHGKIAV
jgi:RNA polymerase sigma-70 factor (ECF subfamily)